MKPLYICPPLRVEAVTRDMLGNNFGKLLGFSDLDGKPKQWNMDAGLLGGGKGDQIRGALLRAGLPGISSDSKAQAKLVDYLIWTSPTARARSVSRIGWHQHAYVMPERTIGDSVTERYILDEAAAHASTFEIAGNLDRWRQYVAQPCGHHRRLIFAVSCAFAGPLIYLAGAESGGFHLVGDSSSGKSMALRFASSVWGHPQRYWIS